MNTTTDTIVDNIINFHPFENNNQSHIEDLHLCLSNLYKLHAHYMYLRQLILLRQAKNQKLRVRQIRKRIEQIKQNGTEDIERINELVQSIDEITQHIETIKVSSKIFNMPNKTTQCANLYFYNTVLLEIQTNIQDVQNGLMIKIYSKVNV